MPLAVALVVLAVLGGTVVSWAYDDDAPLASRVAYGAATGLAAIGLVGFAGAELFGLPVGTLLAAIVVGLPLLALAAPRFRSRVVGDTSRSIVGIRESLRARDRATGAAVVYSIATVVLLWLVFDRVLFAVDGSLATGYVNNLGDLPFHMQVTASFAFGHNFPPEDPTYAGTGFAYPYISDFVAAMLVNLGATMRQAFLIQNLALGLALVALVHRFTAVLTRDRLASYLAPVIVLFSGGLGFLMLLEDARSSEQGIFATLAALTHDYTITGDGPYRWGNAVTTLLVTQRSLLSGLPIALIAFVLLWKLVHAAAPAQTAPAVQTGSSGRRRNAIAFVGTNRLAIAAGVLTGSLPLIHAHSFVVVLATAFLFGLLFRQWRDRRWVGWAIYVAIALVLALPQIWWSTHDSIANAGTFFGLELGWDHGTTNVAWFWLLNTGAFVPLAVVGAWWARRSGVPGRSLVLFCAAFGAWFLIPNVMKLAPWVWDNIKVLFYWFVGFVPLVALAVATLLRGRPAWRAIGAVALAVLVLSGAIDVWRVVSRQSEFQEFDRDGIAVAELIKADTPSRALVLHAPTYNPPVFLTGRRSLLGYTGYIWAHGLDYAQRETDIKSIYAGATNADALLKQYGVEYVLVSPVERGYMPVNDAYFGRFTEVASAGDYKLYRIGPA